MTKVTDWDEEVKKGAPLTWMINATADVAHEFEFDSDEIEEVEVQIKEKLIPEYQLNMRNIVEEVSKGRRIEHIKAEEDGLHNIPFWASRAFREYMAENKPSSWAVIRYTRSVLPDGKNTACFDVA